MRHLLSLLLPACLLAPAGCVVDDEPWPDDQLELSASRFKLRNPITGLCLKRSTTQVVGPGYEVYQASCDDTAAQLWWLDDCDGGECSYVGGDGASHCIKASSSIQSSGGSYNVYAAPCSTDVDQRWTVTDLGGGELQLQNRETARCAAASESETTRDGQPDVVQRTCDRTAGKQRFVKVYEAAAKMPVEVLGPSGTRVSVQVRVDDPSDITHLYLQCHACGYHVTELDASPSKVKATVRINGGAAIPLKRYSGNGQVVGNPRIEVLDGAADYGEIGGVFRTVRLRVPVTGIVAGVNTITFEHVNAAPPSIGFRILDLNLLRGGSFARRVLPAFEQDDPATWSPPMSSAAEISAGQTLWRKRSSLYDPGVDAIDGVLGRAGAVTGAIVASCADCHASDGRDLAYFNFSNRSIIERAAFHGLSRTDGERIASYIRSQRSRVPVVRAARPWHPTYQPGPGMDARPAYEWAAGAGLDAILPRDVDMADELFPAGQSLTAVRQVVGRHGKLNLRELPIALPMPEWNQWLPQIHPDDAFNTQASAIRADERGDGVGKPFYAALYDAAKANPTPSSIGDMTTRIKPWLRRGMTCDTNGAGNGEPWRGLNGGVLNAIKLPKRTYTACVPKDDRRRVDEEAYEIAKRGLAAWIAVKQWEIVHGNNLEDEGAKTQTARVGYVDGARTLSSNRVCGAQCVDARERGWFVIGRNVFDRPPHFIGHNSRHFYGQDLVAGVAETNAWYHLNMILNPGYRIMMPNHFAYVCSHIEILQAVSGVNQGFRFWASMIKQRQLQTNGLYGVETGHDLRTSQPHVYYKANRNGTSATQASVGQPLWRYLAQAMVEDFVADANRATRAQWEAADNNSAVQAWDSENFTTGTVFDTGAYQGRNTFRVIPRLRELGVSSSVVTSLIDWGERTWPNGDWDSLR